MIVIKVLSYIFMFGLGAAVSALYFKTVVAAAKLEVRSITFWYEHYKSAAEALSAKVKKKR